MHVFLDAEHFQVYRSSQIDRRDPANDEIPVLTHVNRNKGMFSTF